MDVDSSSRTMDKGASAALANEDLGSNAVPEHLPRGDEKTTGTGTSIFDSKGSIGKHFTTDGAIGGAAQKIGGPLDASGSIGKQFTTDGSIGGSVQEALGHDGKSAFQK